MKKVDKMPKIINWNNLQPAKGEYNSGELMTVPDGAYTITEIFEKFRRGISLPLEREVTYQDTDDFNEIDLRQVIKDPYDIDESHIKGERLRKLTEVKNESKGPSENPIVEIRKNDDIKQEEKTVQKDEVLQT